MKCMLCDCSFMTYAHKHHSEPPTLLYVTREMIRCDVILMSARVGVGTQVESELRSCWNSGRVGTHVVSELS